MDSTDLAFVKGKTKKLTAKQKSEENARCYAKKRASELELEYEAYMDNKLSSMSDEEIYAYLQKIRPGKKPYVIKEVVKEVVEVAVEKVKEVVVEKEVIVERVVHMHRYPKLSIEESCARYVNSR
jgi:hypothetical protein